MLTLSDQRLTNFTTTASGKFTGPLTFLNSYRYQMGESLLTNLGANTEFASGASFWNRCVHDLVARLARCEI